MSRNGSGTYNRAVSPYTAGTTITAATVNSEMDDIATALTGSMARDGQSPATANIPMGGFRLTGLGNAIASTDAAPLGQVVAKAGDTMTGALGVVAGTAAAPGVFVSGDTNTGLFQPSADTLSVSVGGTEVARYGTGGFMRLADGTAAAPAYSFTGDPDTGIFNVAPNAVGFGLGGVEYLRVDGANLTYTNSNAGGSNSVNLTLDGSIEMTRGSGGAYIDFKNVAGEDADARIAESSNGLAFQTGGNGALAVRMTIPGSGAITVSGDLEASGNLRFNSGYGSAAIAYGVRAWVNFNGTGTVAIRASGGVTSITDNGAGDYTVNFNFTMPDANYAISGICGRSSAGGYIRIADGATPSTTNVRINTMNNLGSASSDSEHVHLNFTR